MTSRSDEVKSGRFVEVKRVPARRRVRWGDRELAWRVESIDRQGVRRTLFDVETGEVLDDVWLDDDGRVRSWSASSTTQGRTDPPAARTARSSAERESIGEGSGAHRPALDRPRRPAGVTRQGHPPPARRRPRTALRSSS
jgi:hypothetical protein